MTKTFRLWWYSAAVTVALVGLLRVARPVAGQFIPELAVPVPANMQRERHLLPLIDRPESVLNGDPLPDLGDVVVAAEANDPAHRGQGEDVNGMQAEPVPAQPVPVAIAHGAAPPNEVVADAKQTEAKRTWLRQSLERGRLTERQTQFVHERVAAMTDKQLDRAIVVQKRKQDQQARAQQQADATFQQAQIAQRNWQQQALRELAFRQNQAQGWRAGFADGIAMSRMGRDPIYVAAPVAYIPVTNWLPDGTTFYSGSQCASPFSNNFGGGYFSGTRSVPIRSIPIRPQSNQQPQVWFDGLRTRYEIPPAGHRPQK